MSGPAPVWSALRARRMLFVAALAAFIPLVIALPRPWGTLAALGGLSVSFVAVRSWRCPRCRNRFAGAGHASWPDYCVSCALPAFATSDAIQAPVASLNPNAERLGRRLRQFIAASQILGGAAVMALVLGYSNLLPGWHVFLLESLGVIAIFAGYLLWRDHPEGYRLTRLLQYLQLVKIQGSAGVFAVAAGFSVELIFTAQGSTISWRQYATLAVGINPQPFYLAVNLLGIVLLVLLAGAKPDGSSILPREAAEASSLASGESAV